MIQLSFNAPFGGLILVRELNERLGFGELIEQQLIDSRANETRLPLADPLRQSVYSRVQVMRMPTTPGGGGDNWLPWWGKPWERRDPFQHAPKGSRRRAMKTLPYKVKAHG